MSNNNRQRQQRTPVPPPPPPPQQQQHQQQHGYHQCRSCRGTGVFGGNQGSNYYNGGNQGSNYYNGGNQGSNYYNRGNQRPNYYNRGNQSKNYYGSNRSNYYGSNNRSNYYNGNQPNNNYNQGQRPNGNNQGGNRRPWNNNRYRSNNRSRSRSQYSNSNNRRQSSWQQQPQRQKPPQSQQQQRPNHNREPRDITIGDWILPQQLSGNNTPTNALPQRAQFTRTTSGNDVNNSTQPFAVTTEQRQLTTTTTTSSSKRNKRRNRNQQQQDRNNNYDNNRYIALDNIDNDDNNDDCDDDRQQLSSDLNNKNTRNTKKNMKKKTRYYLLSDQILKYFNSEQSVEFRNKLQDNRKYDFTKKFLLDATSVYDEWIRTENELKLWKSYEKLGEDFNFWPKEIIHRIRGRPDDTKVIKQFVAKKINYFKSKCLEFEATIIDLQLKYSSYWSSIGTHRQEETSPSSSTTTATRTNANTLARNKFDFTNMEKEISDYINKHIKHVFNKYQTQFKIACAEKEEYQALQTFKTLAEKKPIWNIHLLLKPKLKKWATKVKNFNIIEKRIEYNLPPKFILKNNFSFKFDTKSFEQDEIQPIYDGMDELTNTFHQNTIKYYHNIASRELNNDKNDIDIIIENCRPKLSLLNQQIILSEDSDGQQTQQDNDLIFNQNIKDYEALENYYKLVEKRIKLQADQACPRFIFNDPQTASRRRTTELATLRRKLENRFFERKVSPGRPVQEFINELDVLLQNYHDIPAHPPHSYLNLTTTFSSDRKRRTNVNRTIKRLKHKFRLANVILRKTDKSKVFHLGRLEHYQQRSDEYMEKTQAYQCIGTNDPLPDLINRTNKYLLDLRLAKWITQKQYEQLCVKTEEAELAHLYYLPKAHKPGTPLRPIISGLRHPTLKISKFLDNLLRPLFDQMAIKTTVTSGFDLLQKLQPWSSINLKQETILCTIDVADLYTIIPQVQGVLSLRKMLDHLNIKQINGLKTEAIIRLARFVMNNNYFKYSGQYYHQIRGGAMGSPLTLTIANCYMFFFEQDIVKQITNSFGLYVRFIDDIFIIINWPIRHLHQQVDRWNQFDPNIKLSADINSKADFLDLHLENRDGTLFTSVYYKPSYKPYYLPFNSIHPLHMKRNIPFTMLVRAIRYCSTFQAYETERDHLKMALLINKYPSQLIDQQFNHVLVKFNIDRPLNIINYDKIRQHIINSPFQIKDPIDYDQTMFIHFTYCSNMRRFPQKFHNLWLKYFSESPINDITPVLGTRNVNNLERRLVHTRDS